jgi:2-polyprenyl-3-methyl-5-hydroxy-6-metoxy-1,4-benzoquinol methylase
LTADLVRDDFDRLAAFDDGSWNHNNHYHGFLLRQLPPRIGSALEIGCGAGEFARLLAARADHVTAIDLSPRMLEVARARSAGCTNISYEQRDVMEWDMPAGQYDCIASIATLHHVDLNALVPKLKRALRPGGTLLVLDLYKQQTPVDFLSNVLTIPLNVYYTYTRKRKRDRSPEERAAWDAHGSRDVYLTLDAVRRLSAAHLPGARVTRHLLWRYSLVWRKPI